MTSVGTYMHKSLQILFEDSVLNKLFYYVYSISVKEHIIEVNKKVQLIESFLIFWTYLIKIEMSTWHYICLQTRARVDK